MRLWIDTAETADPQALTLKAGETNWSAEDGKAVDGGLSFVLQLPEGAPALLVQSGDQEWSLPLAWMPPPAWLDEARRLHGEQRWQDLHSLLLEATALPDPGERGQALGLLARQMRGSDPEAARRHLEAALEAHREAGDLQSQVDDGTVLVSLLLEQGELQAARDVLDSLPRFARSSVETSYLLDYYTGLVTEAAGDSRTALAAYGRAANLAERLEHPRWSREARQVLARELQRVGRADEAVRIFTDLRRAADAEGSPCERARLLVNEAWALLLAREAGSHATAEPLSLLREALPLFGRHAAEDCSSPEERRNVWLNLALAHLQDDQPASARRALAEAGKLEGQPHPLLRLWWLDLEGRLALSEGHAARAEEHYAELAELARATAVPEAGWRAAVGQARAHQMAGALGDAVDALLAAERLLDSESRWVPLQRGRDTFLAQRDAGSSLLVDLLLRAGRTAEALDAARRARSRSLISLRRGDRLASLAPEKRQRWLAAMERYTNLRRSLETAAAQDWQRSADELRQTAGEREQLRRDLETTLDEAFALLGDDRRQALPSLPPLPPQQLTLAFHPLPGGGWAAFAAKGESVEVVRLEGPEAAAAADLDTLAIRLLEPFKERIQAAARLRLLPYGALRSLDFHALSLPSLGGRPLLAVAPVAYALDLPGDVVEKASPSLLAAPAAAALVVGDPTGDLVAARREAALVAEALARSGHRGVRQLTGREAEGEAIRSALPGSTLFHFAGHGRFAGVDGWESVLPLAQESHLGVGDVLALPRAPRWVVLSGCETGRTARVLPQESLGLAQSFVVAGARGVVAATRLIDDRATAALIEDFYRFWDSGRQEPAAALRQAQLASRERDPEADWASFRLLEP